MEGVKKSEEAKRVQECSETVTEDGDGRLGSKEQWQWFGFCQADGYLKSHCHKK